MLFTDQNLVAVRSYVENDCACHWDCFRENCDDSDIWEFCEVDYFRNEEEIADFVNKYI